MSNVAYKSVIINKRLNNFDTTILTPFEAIVSILVKPLQGAIT